MEQTIDLYILRNMPSGKKACIEARNWFEETFCGGGADMQEAWNLLKSSDVAERYDWLVWFGCHWLPSEDVDDFTYFVIGLAMDAVGDPIYGRNATPENYADLHEGYGDDVWLNKRQLLSLEDYIDNAGNPSDFYPSMTPLYGDEMIQWLEDRIFAE